MANDNMDIIESCTYYSFKGNLSSEDIKALQDAGFEDEYNIDGIIDGQSVIDWNLENCVNLESRSFSDIDCIALLQSWIGYHAHYLVFAQGCRWNGASGYTIVPRILDTLHRPYDATFHYKNHIEGRALICMESSHDVPTGSTTVIVGLTDKEFEKFEDAEFSEVEAFAEQFIE